MTADQAYAKAAEGELKRASDEVTLKAQLRKSREESEKRQAIQAERNRLANEMADAREAHEAMKQAKPSILERFLAGLKQQ